MLYLLEKPEKFNKPSIQEFKDLYCIYDIYSHLKDSSDLLNDIKALDEVKLMELYSKYFSGLEDKYTDDITLQIIFELLLKAKKSARGIYNDDFGTIDSGKKIEINKLNSRVASHINLGLDFTLSIYNFDDHNQIGELRSLVVDNYYANILRQNLRMNVQHQKLQAMNISDLHKLATREEICFNKVLFALKDVIESSIVKVDFNSQSVSWIIIAYFFELCDVGVKK